MACFSACGIVLSSSSWVLTFQYTIVPLVLISHSFFTLMSFVMMMSFAFWRLITLLCMAAFGKQIVPECAL
jgi:hypothetical protein